jgi:hypothetical protein
VSQLELDDRHPEAGMALEDAGEDQIAQRQCRIERLGRAAAGVAQCLVSGPAHPALPSRRRVHVELGLTAHRRYLVGILEIRRGAIHRALARNRTQNHLRKRRHFLQRKGAGEADCAVESLPSGTIAWQAASGMTLSSVLRRAGTASASSHNG